MPSILLQSSTCAYLSTTCQCLVVHDTTISAIAHFLLVVSGRVSASPLDIQLQRASPGVLDLGLAQPTSITHSTRHHERECEGERVLSAVDSILQNWCIQNWCRPRSESQHSFTWVTQPGLDQPNQPTNQRMNSTLELSNSQV